MSRTGSIFVAAILAGGATGCLLYTDPINMPPEVVIEAPPELYRNTTATFTAKASDRDQTPESLQFRWGTGPGCPAAADAGNQAGVPGPNIFDFRHGEVGAFCVWVIVIDDQGAEAFATAEVTIKNRLPIPSIKIASPGSAGDAFDLYSAFRVSAEGSQDADLDTLSYDWRVTLPDQRMMTPGACPPPYERTDVCFKGDAPGPYQVDLTVDDGMAKVPATRIITVNPDRLPCIRTTDPDFSVTMHKKLDAKTVLHFSVLHVDDDGDPLPGLDGAAAGSGSFVWTVQLPGDVAYKRFFGDTSTFDLSLETTGGGIRIGDVLNVRVAYQDRIPRDYSGCEGPATAPCQLDPKLTCFQAVTWTYKNDE